MTHNGKLEATEVKQHGILGKGMRRVHDSDMLHLGKYKLFKYKDRL